MKAALKWLAVGLAASAFALLATQVLTLEGLAGTAMSLVSTDKGNTEYAAGYSDWKLRWLRHGSSKDEALARLGAPLEEWDREKEGRVQSYWKYSRAKKKADYHVRLLVFDENGRLVKKVAEFYMD